MTVHKLVFAIAIGALAIGTAVAVAQTDGTEETGTDAWCYRPSLIWRFVPDIDAYATSITCEERELPGGGKAWSSETTAELAIRPDDWTMPGRAVRERTRWAWVHGYDAATGEAYVLGPMRRRDGQSPTEDTQPTVYLSVQCSPGGALHLGLTSDAALLDGQHAVVWWTDNSEYRRAELWDAQEVPDVPNVFLASAPEPSALWAEIRDSSKLHVVIFGERSWHMADADISRISDLAVVEVLDYCGQSAEPEAEE